MDGAIFELLIRYWRRPLGLVVGLIFALGVYALITGPLTLTNTWSLSILAALFLGTFVSWFASRRLPKAMQGKIGVAVAIHCEDELATQVREDFVIQLKSELLNSQAAAFQFLDIPRDLSDITSHDEASTLLTKCRASFVVVGRAKRRITTGGAPCEFIELIGMVRHAPVHATQKQLLEEEFARFLPRKLQFKSDGSVFAFEFTAEWTSLVAKYIVAIAAGLSNDLDLSERLFREVQRHNAVRTRNFFLYRQLRERLPEHLSALYQARAFNAIDTWYRDHDPTHIERLGQILAAVKAHGWSNAAFTGNECFYVYLTTGNTEEALRILQRVREEHRDAIWELNRAYLMAREGKLRRARVAYERAARKGIPTAQTDVVVGQVENFLTWRAQLEPNSPEVWYCLAIVNLLLKGDAVQARRDTDRFVATCTQGQYAKEALDIQNLLERHSSLAPDS